jgi:hypothetical protein
MARQRVFQFLLEFEARTVSQVAMKVPTAIVAMANQEAVSVTPRNRAGMAAVSEATVAMMAVVIVVAG